MIRRTGAALCAACAFFHLGCGDVVVADRGAGSSGGSTTSGPSGTTGGPAGTAGACPTGDEQAAFGATPEGATIGVAAGPGGVYWTNDDGSVWKAGSAGAAPHPIAGAVGPGLYTIALGAGSVFLTDYASKLVRIDEGGGAPVVLAAPPAGVMAVAADDTGAYFTSIDGVRRVDPQGGASVLLAPVEDADSIVVDEDFVYVRTVGNTGDSTNRVVRIPKSGGAPVDLAPGEPGPLHYFAQEIAVDATNVYWVNPSAGTVSRVPKAGGTPVVLASGLADPVSIAADGGFVYIAVRGKDGGPFSDRAIGKVSTAGGPVSFVAKGPDVSPYGLALDATRVYWTQKAVGGAVGTACK